MKKTIPGGLGRFLLGSAAVAVTLAASGLMAQPTVKTLGGGAVTGYFGYKDTNTLYSLFHTPSGLAVDPNGGTVYVADRDNNAVRELTDFQDANNGFTFTFTTNFLSKPVGVALDADGDVYVLNRGTINPVSTNGSVLEFGNIGGYSFLLTTNASGLTNASGIAVDPYGNIFVTERSNLLVEIYASNGVQTTVATVPFAGASLQGIAIMPNGLIAACDSGRNGIYEITPDPTNPAAALITTNAGFNGQGDGTGINNEGMPTWAAKFNQPMGVAAAGDGTLIVSDYGNDRVKVITTSGLVTNFYGVSSNDWATTFPGWLDGQVVVPDQPKGVASRCPNGVVLSPDGTTVYTTEDFYHLVRKVTGQSFEAPIQPVPAVPTGLTATVETNQQMVEVFLTWSSDIGATSYIVSRSSQSGAGYVAIGNTTLTSFADTNVASGATYYYVVQAVDSGGQSDDSTQVMAIIPIPPPAAPTIGTFDYEGNAFTGFFTVLHPFANGVNVFNNDIMLAILPNVPQGTGVSTLYASGPVPFTNGLPNNGSSPSQVYTNGLSYYPPLQITTYSNLIIAAVNQNFEQEDSAIVSDQIVFQCANPGIVGDNAAQFTLDDATTNCVYYYTTDGTDPLTNAPPSQQIVTTNGQPVTLSLNIQTNFVFSVRAVRPNYLPSPIFSEFFSSSNFVPNTISWGFQSGEASSVFIGAAGETFYAPVTLSMLPGAAIYSLQFNMMVTNAGVGITNSGPPVLPNSFSFQSMLMKPIPNTTPVIYTNIPPYMFADYETNSVPAQDVVIYNNGTFINLLITNNAEDLLAVGWLERYGQTNLYNTVAQDLIKYSIARDTLFPDSNQPNGVIVGGYAFKIPANAAIGDQYQINIGSPSATSDGIGEPGSAVDIFTPTSTNALGAGTLNSIKTVTVGSVPYLVGDVYNFRWFNAGDFGTGNLSAQGSADAEQAFENAVYGLGIYAVGSDFVDAMNSSGAYGILDNNPSDEFYGYYTNAGALTQAQLGTLFNANASSFSLMDQMVFGHPSNPYDSNNGPEISDVYVTYVRSLDPGRTWYKRLWTNGVLVAETTPNLATAVKLAVRTAEETAAVPAKTPSSLSITNTSITNTPSVNFSSTDFLATAGQTLTIPINASIFGPYPLRMLMLNLSVVPLDGSPALTTPVSFTPNSALNTALGSTTPWDSDSHGNGNYAAAWLPSSSTPPYELPGLAGNANIGYLTVTIPANASSMSSYAIHFDAAAASPSGLIDFPRKTLTGLITLSSRTNSYYGDGIPDSWRLRYFGTIYNELSVSNADADGTGMNNYQKYLAGLDPQDSTSVLNEGIDQAAAQSPQDHVVYWPSVNGQTYVIERSTTLFPAQWTPIATVVGDGTYMEIHDAPGAGNYYYQVTTQ